MILAVDTSTPITKLILAKKDGRIVQQKDVETGNKLSEVLLSLIEEVLANESLKLSDLSGLILVSGPGSFTGLRIGASTLNALAYALEIPIVGVKADDKWFEFGISRLKSSEDDSVVKLNYGAEPHITKQKK